jgi:GLPGLI family protein
MGKRIYIALFACIIFAAIYQTFSTGYGCADEIIYLSEQTLRNSPTPAPEQLTVIYERQIGKSSDLLHLRIDTTYHQIGKGAYKHELRAEREYSLRSFDGTYTDMNDAVALCFVEGSREWQTEKMQQHNVAGYNCQRATLTIGEMRYQAWYSDALPHLHQGAQGSDGQSGLILEAHSADMRYSLRAKYIGQRIG